MTGFKAASLLIALAPACSLTWGLDRPCDQVVGLLTTEFIYRVPNSELPRVEIRQCDSSESATIQLVAWRSGDKDPSLVLNTDDFGVVQTVARANTFVIETGGATTAQVFVIVYNQGEPRLALKRVTKGTARVDVTQSAIDLLIEGIYAGDSPPRSESQHFSLNANGLKRAQ